MKRVLGRSTGLAVVTAVSVVAATAVPADAHLVEGTLPGGTNISVSIDSPADGAVLPPGPVTVTGTAAVGTGQPNTGLIYVVDVSGSTDDVITNCPNPGDDILDCEKAAAIALNDVAVDAAGEVGAVFFGTDALAADVDPAAGPQLITEPAADNDGNGVPDVEQVLASAQIGEFTDFMGTQTFVAGTSYGNAVTAAVEAAEASTMDRVLVAFLSDGRNEEAPAVSGLDDIAENIDFHTFAIGDFDCTNDPNNLGSLEDIAVGTGGLCREVDTIAGLPEDLLEAFASELSGLSLTVGNGLPTPITDVTPPLPQEGPASVEYSVTTGPLGAGSHELCVTATGSDAGGPGSVTDCHTITINAPPTVDAGGPYAGQEGSPVDIAGEVTDPDSPVTAQWTYEPVTADAGTECEFADDTAVITTVTCTDDGEFELTLTADDGVNPPVSDTATLTLTNEAPVVTITAPADGDQFEAGTEVEFVAPFTDAGANDTHTCTVDFDDGTPVADGAVAQEPGSGTCTISHSFTAVGPHNVLVTVTDDDGDSGTAVVTVVVFLPGEAWAIQTNGLVTIPKTPHATCPPDETLTQAQLNVAPVAVVNALNASCTVDPATGETIATASVNQASLLGGAITISNISSSCVSNADGVTRSSSVGTINGTPIGTGSGSISIPLVATVFFNESTSTGGQLGRNAIRVQTLLGQQIILAACRLG